MKSLIRFLARISWVEKEIQFCERHNCARKIIGASYWFSDKKKYGVMYPFMYWLGKSIGSEFGVVGEARNEYDKIKEEINLELEGWPGIEFNQHIGTLKITTKPL